MWKTWRDSLLNIVSIFIRGSSNTPKSRNNSLSTSPYHWPSLYIFPCTTSNTSPSWMDKYVFATFSTQLWSFILSACLHNIMYYSFPEHAQFGPSWQGLARVLTLHEYSSKCVGLLGPFDIWSFFTSCNFPSQTLKISSRLWTYVTGNGVALKMGLIHWCDEEHSIHYVCIDCRGTIVYSRYKGGCLRPGEGLVLCGNTHNDLRDEIWMLYCELLVPNASTFLPYHTLVESTRVKSVNDLFRVSVHRSQLEKMVTNRRLLTNNAVCQTSTLKVPQTIDRHHPKGIEIELIARRHFVTTYLDEEQITNWTN